MGGAQTKYTLSCQLAACLLTAKQLNSTVSVHISSDWSRCVVQNSEWYCVGIACWLSPCSARLCVGFNTRSDAVLCQTSFNELRRVNKSMTEYTGDHQLPARRPNQAHNWIPKLWVSIRKYVWSPLLKQLKKNWDSDNDQWSPSFMTIFNKYLAPDYIVSDPCCKLINIDEESSKHYISHCQYPR